MNGYTYKVFDTHSGIHDNLVRQRETALFLTERTGSAASHWLTVELEAPGMNRFAIGASVIAEVGGRKLLRFVKSGGSFASASDLRLHFGLGAATTVDRLEVTWPDGSKQTETGVACDRKLRWRKGAPPEPRLP